MPSDISCKTSTTDIHLDTSDDISGNFFLLPNISEFNKNNWRNFDFFKIQVMGNSGQGSLFFLRKN